MAFPRRENLGNVSSTKAHKGSADGWSSGNIDDGASQYNSELQSWRLSRGLFFEDSTVPLFRRVPKTADDAIRHYTRRMENVLQSWEDWAAKPDAESTKDDQIRSYLPSGSERLTVFPARTPVSDGEQKPWELSTGRETTQPRRSANSRVQKRTAKNAHRQKQDSNMESHSTSARQDMSQSANFAGYASQLGRTSESLDAQLNTNQYLEDQYPERLTFTTQPSVPQWSRPPESMNNNFSAYLQNNATTMPPPTPGLGVLDASTFAPDQSYPTAHTSPDQTRSQALGVPSFHNSASSSNYRTYSHLDSGPAGSLSQYPRIPYLIEDVPSLARESSSERSGSSPVVASSGDDLLVPSNLGYSDSAGSFSLNSHHGRENRSVSNRTKLCNDADTTKIEWNTFVDFPDELED